MTHASIQNGSAVEDAGRAVLYRDVYRKPIVFDEVKYEGDIPQRWGNLSAEEMVHRFWQGTIAGTYVGHGETYLHPEDDILWWSKGGVLRGQSPRGSPSCAKVLEEGPPEGLEPIDKWQDARTAGKKGEYYLIYFGKEKPTEWTFEYPEGQAERSPEVACRPDRHLGHDGHPARRSLRARAEGRLPVPMRGHAQDRAPGQALHAPPAAQEPMRAPGWAIRCHRGNAAFDPVITLDTTPGKSAMTAR